MRLILCSLLQIPSLLTREFTDYLVEKCLVLLKTIENDDIVDIIELCLYNSQNSHQMGFMEKVDLIMSFFKGKITLE